MRNSTGYVIKQLVHAFSPNCALSRYGALGKFGELSRSELWGTWEVWRALKKRVMGHLGGLESSQEASYGALGKFGELSGS